MRRTTKVALGLAVCVLLPVTGCDGSGSQPETTQPETTGSTETTGSAVPAPAPEASSGPAEETPSAAESEPEPEASLPPQVEAVVSSNDRATEAGVRILAAGGTAADASVAVAAVLSVVEPFYSSVLGGDTWALYYDASDEAVTSVNGVGPVGSEATLADYRTRADTYGMHQAIVPGAWDGWMVWLEDYGELGLGEILAPAVEAAREGHPVSTEMTYWLTLQEANIRESPVMSGLYLRDGALIDTGETFYQPDMADTLDALAGAYEAEQAAGHAAGIQAARDYFYRGPVAESIVAYSNEFDGYLTEADLDGYEAEIIDPISIDYGDGITVYQNPPNSQGIAMLQALNILKNDDFSGLSAGDPEVIHRQVEAVKLAYADRFEYVGDPDRARVPVDDLLSDEYAARQRERIDPDSAAAWPIDSGLERQATDTTTFHITDAAGSAAAVTTSLGGQFLVVGDTGIHINERMKFMSLDENNVNVVAPGATVRHTSNPYLALRDGRPYLLGGNTGIDTQPQGQVQQFMSVVEFGLTPQEAVAQPRFVSTAFPSSNFPYSVENTLQLEESFPDGTVESLRSRGHEVAGAGIVGTAQMIMVDDDGRSAQVGVEPRNETASGSVIPPD